MVFNPRDICGSNSFPPSLLIRYSISFGGNIGGVCREKHHLFPFFPHPSSPIHSLPKSETADSGLTSRSQSPRPPATGPGRSPSESLPSCSRRHCARRRWWRRRRPCQMSWRRRVTRRGGRSTGSVRRSRRLPRSLLDHRRLPFPCWSLRRQSLPKP